MKYSDKKLQLLNSAVELYNRKGDITIRELASACEMNVAAVNYYFGTKENLISEVEKYIYETINGMAEKISRDSSLDAVERLYAMFTGLIGYFLKNPGTVRLFYSILGVNNDRNFLLISKIIDSDNAFIGICYNALREVSGITDKTELFNRYLMLLCTFVPPFLFGMLDSDMKSLLTDTADLPPFGESSSEWTTPFIKNALKIVLKP